MNLMFRKNFREGGGGGKSSGAGAKMSGNKPNRSQGKRSRDIGYGGGVGCGGGGMDDVHYRTHLFFSPTRQCYQDNVEGFLFFFLYFLFKIINNNYT